jgi:hypothetical protein
MILIFFAAGREKETFQLNFSLAKKINFFTLNFSSSSFIYILNKLKAIEHNFYLSPLMVNIITGISETNDSKNDLICRWEAAWIAAGCSPVNWKRQIRVNALQNA